MSPKKLSDKKKRRVKVKVRHWILLIIIRILFSPSIFLYFLFRPRYYRLKKKGPMLILINHVTEFDILLANNLFNFPLYFVASEQLLNKGFSSWLLNYVFAPIPKSKSMTDIAIVPRIKRVLDEGGNVCIFPEGNMTMTGTISSMPPAIGKLIKLMKVPVVFVESYGLYFASPRWSRFRKYGPTGMRIKRIMEPEEFREMNGDDLNQLVIDELRINAYEQHPIRKYRGIKKAAGLERLVFSCPSCHQPFKMRTKGSKLFCDACGYEAKYDVYGYVNGPTGRLDTVTLDGIVKRDYIKYVANNYETLNLSVMCDVRYFRSGAKRRSRKYRKLLSLSYQGIKLEGAGESEHYNLDEVLSYTMQTRRKFIIYVHGNLSIVAKFPVTVSPYMYLITTQLLHDHYAFEKGEQAYDPFAHLDDIATLGL